MYSLNEIYEQNKKQKNHEKLFTNSVVEYMKSKFNFNPKKITVKKKFSDGYIGDVSITDTSLGGKFTVHYNPDQGYRMIIAALIHELTHVKQIDKRELKPSDDWKSLVWKDDTFVSVKDYKKAAKDFNKYKELPWEQEAYHNQHTLVDDFIDSKFFKNLKGKDNTLDFIIDNI